MAGALPEDKGKGVSRGRAGREEDTEGPVGDLLRGRVGSSICP